MRRSQYTYYLSLEKPFELQYMLLHKLSRRIRITYDPQKIKRSSEKNIRYYKKYARLVSETLRDPLFQTVLHGIIQKEDIAINKIRDIQVKTFPSTKENGNKLAGKCSNKGVIYLYPKEVSFCQKMMINWKEDTVNFYIRCRARAALIHEILHIKYMDKEFKVRGLTRKYFKVFIRRKKLTTQNQIMLQKLFPTTHCSTR